LENAKPDAKTVRFVVLAGEVEMKYEVYSHATPVWIAPFPERTDVRWETTSLQVWNSQEGTAEEQDLVYEVSWVKDLGMWRRFLTARRKVQN
jgi:hypothetical protein